MDPLRERRAVARTSGTSNNKQSFKRPSPQDYSQPIAFRIPKEERCLHLMGQRGWICSQPCGFFIHAHYQLVVV